MPPFALRRRTCICTVGTGHTPMSTTRPPLERIPAITACFTISPDVRGSRPTTIVPEPVCVPNACAKRVSNVGVNAWPMTPRTPEMLIFRVGIALMFYKSATKRHKKHKQVSQETTQQLREGLLPRCGSVPQPVARPVQQLGRGRLLFRLDDDANDRLRVRRAHVHPAIRQRDFHAVDRIKRQRSEEHTSELQSHSF